MNFSENTNLLPGGQSASPSKLKELNNKIDDLAQTVTSVADSVADLADEVTTAELNATDANVTNAVIDNATVGTETATTVNATTANADNLNATDADITNLTADDVEANSVDADNGYFGSVNAQSFTGQGVNITGDITASNKVQGKTVQATEKVVTPALESTQTELKGATTVRGDVYFPETGDKIYGEYLEVDANKVDANTVKVNSLTTETPTGSSQLVGYDANGKLIPVNAGLDPSNYWELVPNDQTAIQPKDNKKIEATEITTSTLNAEDINASGDATVNGEFTVTESAILSDTFLYSAIIDENLNVFGDVYVEKGKTTLKNTEVDGDLTVNGDIIQNGSAYETHAEKVYSKNDLIITRDGAVSGLSTGQYTGIQAKKYDGTNDGQLVFDKDGEARVGDVGDTEPLMTRDELANMTTGRPLTWDGTNKKAVCGSTAQENALNSGITSALVTKLNEIVLECYLLPNRPDVGRDLVTVLGVANAADAFAALRTRADAGNFSGLRLGDYIDIPSMTIDGSAISNSNQRLRFEIAGFDTYLNIGDTPTSSHHILMISKNCVLQKAMNSTATNTGGYPASELCAYLNNQVKTGLVNAIGITPKTVHRLLDNKTDWAWLAETVFIPTEVEVIGHQAWSNNRGYSTGTSVQWPLFSEFPQKRIANWNGSRWWWWEASPRTDDSARFCYCGGSGHASDSSADDGSYGVRFAFLV